MSASHDLAGRRLRDYDVLELVGKGGMGAVYRARHVLLQEERAIKVIAPKTADDRVFTERFIREARVLARLRDDHLVRLYEFWEDEGRLFMALEFLRGESLARRLKRRGRLAVAEAVAVARDAALGLKAAHEQNVVHRDISPDNLQIVAHAGGEIVKVMDFGIAKALEEVSVELTANTFLGKLEYASPEQCGHGLKKDEQIDWRSDVYSLGVTLFKTLTGSAPFEATTPHAYLYLHAAQAPPVPSSIAPDAGIPEALDRLVLRMLAKDRGDRPQSMAALVQEIDAIPVEAPVGPERTDVAGKTTADSGPARRTAPSGITHPTATGMLAIGDAFARKYVIEARLGEGGMGVVYRAIDTILDEPVALKVISERLMGGQDAFERLKREVVLARRVSHPNVCRIHDIGESESGTPYVSMEYIDGSPLGEVIAAKGRFTLGEGVPIVRQVLDALGAAHRVGVVHRDLKPDNIMLTRDGRAIIMDFGLSLGEDSQRVTRAGSVVGTPHYMSPEQVRGAHVDRRSDLYAVGVILFRMFTGRLPFSGSLVDIMRAHLEATPPRPSQIDPRIPEQLESIILTALAKQASERFSSAEAFLTALDPVEPASVRESTESGRILRGAGVADRPRDGGTGPTRLAGSAPEASGATVAETGGDTVAAGGGADLTRTTVAPTPDGKPTRQLSGARTVPASARATPRQAAWMPWALAAGLVTAAVVGWQVVRPAGGIVPAVSTAAGSLPAATEPPATAPAAEASSTTESTRTAPPAPSVAPATVPAGPPATRTAAPPATRVAPAPAPTTPPTTAPPVAPTLAPAPPTTLAAPPPTTLPPPPTTLPPPKLTPEQGVRKAIAEFADALSRLDRDAVRAIYPNFPDRNFEGLDDFKAYHVDIEVSKIQVEKSRVVVETKARHTYTSFSGKQESRDRKERMIFIEGRGGWVRVE